LNLLVGGTGFVGGHLVEYLFQQGEISKGTFRKGAHLKIMDGSGVQGIEADLLDHHSLHEAMEGVDAVYSLASPMPGEDKDFSKTNTEGILNLLEVATESNVKVLVHLSTLDVYGFRSALVTPSSPPNPANEYQRAKAEAERLLHEFSRRGGKPAVVIVRAAKAVGSRETSLVVPMLRMAKAGKVVLPSTPSMSFTHPRDIAQAMFKAATAGVATGSSYMVKSFDCTPEDLARSLAESIGAKAEFKKQGILSGSPLPRYTAEQLRGGLRIEMQPAWKELGYEPQYDLKGTAEEVAAWYKKEPWVTEAT
jgi:nucleoside-diphosphate-sugar epimerase